MIEDLIRVTENCRFCLMCRHVAPVELITHKETHSPHGWALLISSEKRGLIEWNEDSVNQIYCAPDAGNSRAHCVTDQKLPEAIAAARSEIVERGLAPQIVYQVNEAIEYWRNPFEKKLPELNSTQARDGLFVGDEAKYLWPEAITAAMELLEATGFIPVKIGVGRNNGYIASSLGFPETARSLAFEILDEIKLSHIQRLFVLSPGDYFTFRNLYRERLGIEWPENVEIIEVLDFLNNRFESGELSFNTSNENQAYAYVDPTHAVRVPSRHAIPRNLIKKALGYRLHELLWREDHAHPVGNTALQFTQPEIANKLTAARLTDASNSGAKFILCEDPGTLSKLNENISMYDLEVKGLYEHLKAKLT